MEEFFQSPPRESWERHDLHCSTGKEEISTAVLCATGSTEQELRRKCCSDIYVKYYTIVSHKSNKKPKGALDTILNVVRRRGAGRKEAQGAQQGASCEDGAARRARKPSPRSTCVHARALFSPVFK